MSQEEIKKEEVTLEEREKKAQEIKRQITDKVAILKERITKGETIPSAEKIHVAVLADSPTVVTGFGNVCKELLLELYNTGMYEFDIVGINYDGSPHNLPFRIYPAYSALIQNAAYQDIFGRQKFLDLIGQGKFDIVWVLQDSFILAESLAKLIKDTNDGLGKDGLMQFASIFYFPIDATPKKRWIDASAMFFDIPVVYTKYGYNEIIKLYSFDENSLLKPEEKEVIAKERDIIEKKLKVCYHGCNLKNFHPIEDAEKIKTLREMYWADKKDKFVFMNVNRNQPRKDIFRTLLAFKTLVERRRSKGKNDVYLYLHCALSDAGLNIVDMAKQLNLVDGEEFAYPDQKMFQVASGYPIETLNALYNASDAVITTTLGEGWGLSVSEAMAVKKPIIAPNHTSITEMLGKIGDSKDENGNIVETLNAERGILVKTGGTFVQHDDNSRIRPFVDVEDLVNKMEYLVEHREEYNQIVENAYAWIKELQWSGEKIGGFWKQTFEDAYNQKVAKQQESEDKMITFILQKKKLGRNEDCPVCKNVKYKNCKHYAE
jgi:glycosyltransferase involved in cell wall biosynthesis